jgi:hypothetical protein
MKRWDAPLLCLALVDLLCALANKKALWTPCLATAAATRPLLGRKRGDLFQAAWQLDFEQWALSPCSPRPCCRLDRELYATRAQAATMLRRNTELRRHVGEGRVGFVAVNGLAHYHK